MAHPINRHHNKVAQVLRTLGYIFIAGSQRSRADFNAAAKQVRAGQFHTGLVRVHKLKKKHTACAPKPEVISLFQPRTFVSFQSGCLEKIAGIWLNFEQETLAERPVHSFRYE